MAKNLVGLIFLAAILVQLHGMERHYNVPKELEISFMSARGRYPQFQGIDCTQPVELKTICKDYPLMSKWHWNHDTKRCELVSYYGCEPTRNNFHSQVACLDIAGPICAKVDDEKYRYYYDTN